MKNKDINFVDNLDGCSDIIKIPTKNYVKKMVVYKDSCGKIQE